MDRETKELAAQSELTRVIEKMIVDGFSYSEILKIFTKQLNIQAGRLKL
jgi:DNA-binding transcriptional regulator YhcF (GntR family)